MRHQAADWTSPVNAARTASSRSASVKPPWSWSRATTRSTKTPRFSNGTRSAAAQTARSCESVKATMRPWSCRRVECQSLSPCALLFAARTKRGPVTAWRQAHRHYAGGSRPAAALPSRRWCRVASAASLPPRSRSDEATVWSFYPVLLHLKQMTDAESLYFVFN